MSDHPAVRSTGAPRSQIGGDHYSQYEHQPLAISIEWNLDGALYSALKYICRRSHKGSEVKDLKKACHFIALELECRHGITDIARRVADALGLDEGGDR